MTDKLDLRVPRHTPFAPPFRRLYPELRALKKGPFHPSKHYEYAGNLRDYGFNVRLNLYCQMDKAGNHKIELIDVGQMTRTQILKEVGQIFNINALALSVMRVDFAVDVPDLPLQWFRETVRVEHKRFRAAVTGQPFYSEMGKGSIQTLYFGKRPNLIRIYDKQAECQDQYRTLVRKLGKDVEPPSFESVFGSTSVLTRVELQIGGRIPSEVATLQQVIDSHVSFETRCTGSYLQSMAQNDGMHAVNAFLSKYSNGNASRVRKKYEPFLASASETGTTEAELQRRFEESLHRQMSV